MFQGVSQNDTYPHIRTVRKVPEGVLLLKKSNCLTSNYMKTYNYVFEYSEKQHGLL